MVSSQREFILNLAEDVESYAVLDLSLVQFFSDCGPEEVLDYTLHPNLIFADSFSFPNSPTFERELTHQIHRAHRKGRGSCAQIRNSYSNSRTNRLIHRHAQENERLRKLLDYNCAIPSIGKLIEHKKIDGCDISSITYPHATYRQAHVLSLCHPVTIFTVDQAVADWYVNFQRSKQDNGEKRLEVALLYPDQRSMSYLYPELVTSDRFDDLLPMAA